MAEAVKKRSNRYGVPAATYGSVASDLNYTGSTARPLERGGAEILRPKPRVRQKERAVTRPVVRVREAGHVSLFAVVGFLAVGVFDALLLTSDVQRTVATDNIAGLKTQLSSLEAEHNKLLAQYELAYDLNSIEAQVTANGSMVKPEAGQIYTLDLSEPDSVVWFDQTKMDEAETPSLWEELSAVLGGIVEYFR